MANSSDAYIGFPNKDFTVTPVQLCFKWMRAFRLIWMDICWNPDYKETELSICAAVGAEFWGAEIKFSFLIEAFGEK